MQRVLKEDLFTEMNALSFQQNHVFYEIFNRKLQQLIDAGITNYHIDNEFESLNPKQYEHLYVNEPKILTLFDLEAGFEVWLVTLAFAIAVFMFEWLVRFKDFLVFKYVFGAFCEQIKQIKPRSEEMRRLIAKFLEERETAKIVTVVQPEIEKQKEDLDEILVLGSNEERETAVVQTTTKKRIEKQEDLDEICVFDNV